MTSHTYAVCMCVLRCDLHSCVVSCHACLCGLVYLHSQWPICARNPLKLRTNWGQYNLSTSVWRGLLLRFSSDVISRNCQPANSLKMWLPTLQWHVSQPQSLCIAPSVSLCVHRSPTDIFLSHCFIEKSTGNFQIHLCQQPSRLP